eukprot:4787549-Amphidinium_carterae.1
MLRATQSRTSKSLSVHAPSPVNTPIYKSETVYEVRAHPTTQLCPEGTRHKVQRTAGTNLQGQH